MAASGSKYGLFIPKKTNKGAVLKPASANVFGDDSDEESGAAAVNQTVNRESARAKVKKQTQLEIDKALQEDPSVYEYDSIYYNIQAQKVSTDVKEAHKVDRKPKYIAGLLKMAEIRKKEEERRIERKVQQERAEEGDQFADKEAFVTSAYKQKMLEQQAEAERERREAAMEEMLDVTKQRDLSGFYRYLYRETTGTAPAEAQDAENTEEKEKKHRTEQDAPAKHTDRQDSDDDDDDRTPQSESRSSAEKSRSGGSSRRRSRSREKDRHCHSHRHRHSRSPSPSHSRSHRNRHRSRSREGRRDRSSSRDRVKRRSRSGDRQRPREEEGISRKKSEKRAPQGSREERSPSAEERDAAARAASPSPDRASSPEMLPARPPDEDLDRDDSASESDSPADEAPPRPQERRGMEGHQEAKERKKKDEPPDVGGKKTEEPPAKYSRKTTEKEVSDARQRFLARKLARERAKPVVEAE